MGVRQKPGVRGDSSRSTYEALEFTYVLRGQFAVQVVPKLTLALVRRV